MYWTLSLATTLDDAPWPLTKEELIGWASRSGVPMAAIDNLQELEDDEIYESILDIWDEYGDWATIGYSDEE